MKKEEVKRLILESMSEEQAGTKDRQNRLEEAGITYSFGNDFRDKVLDRLFRDGVVIKREAEFLRSWNVAFSRIALTGVAAIILLLISIYISEGSFSINSILGISGNIDENIVYLLTGN